MKRLSVVTLTLSLIIALPAWAQDAGAPSPEKLELARRALDSTEGPLAAALEQSLRALAKVSPFSTAPDLYLAAVGRTLDTYRDVFADTDRLRARAYAAAYTDEDMRAILSFRESPLGKAITAKERAIAEQMVRDGKIVFTVKPELTPEEAAAQQAFIDGPGKKMHDRAMKAKTDALLAAGPVMAKTIRDAMLDFCAGGGQCSPDMLKRLGAEAKP